MGERLLIADSSMGDPKAAILESLDSVNAGFPIATVVPPPRMLRSGSSDYPSSPTSHTPF